MAKMTGLLRVSRIFKKIIELGYESDFDEFGPKIVV